MAGTGTAGFSGDGGPATAAQIRGPFGLALDRAGNLYIADTSNHRVRRVNPSGVITTVAGDGTSGVGGDGGPATAARLSFPRGLTLDASGNVWIADLGNNRVRVMSPEGNIRTAAGTGVAADLNTPRSIAFDPSGNALIAESNGHRILRLERSGALTPIAGTGAPGFAGDGGPATAALLQSPGSLAVNQAGHIFFVDTQNHRIRRLTPDQTGGGADGPRISPGGVVGAGLSVPSVRAISPNAIFSIFGERFAAAGTQRLVSGADLVNGRLPTRLGGVCVNVGSEPARIFHVFPGQLNVQAPTLSAGGNAAVQVLVNCGEPNEVRSNTETVPVQAVSPEFFFVGPPGDARRIAAIFQAGRLATLFMTGLGLTAPPFASGELPDRAGTVVGSVSVMVGGMQLSSQDILYLGVTPSFAGLYQLNLRLPTAVPAGPAGVEVRVGGGATPAGALLDVPN